ncbi:MAG: hypothetical protein Q7S87_06855 [Agitococcus sp.]|nr:hypothetical protein [Agitococcus sp.]MDO9179964.1 hypothetical protein [Agitococcus sp.]
MNRLRILKQRIRRGNDVGISKLSDGYAVCTGRFGGDCVMRLTKRAAIQMAARWAMPHRPQVVIITQGQTETTFKTTSQGATTATTRQLSL